jgi:hypothetical protein
MVTQVQEGEEMKLKMIYTTGRCSVALMGWVDSAIEDSLTQVPRLWLCIRHAQLQQILQVLESKELQCLHDRAYLIQTYHFCYFPGDHASLLASFKHSIPPTMNSNGRSPVVIIGAGISGLCMAINLVKENKICDFVILEKGAGIGGTWQDNTYPGCCCDGRSFQNHKYRRV